MFLYSRNINLHWVCKSEFQKPLFQSSVSHDPLEIILYADLVLKKHFLISIFKIELNIFFVEIVIPPPPQGLFDEQSSAFLWNEFFCKSLPSTLINLIIL